MGYRFYFRFSQEKTFDFRKLIIFLNYCIAIINKKNHIFCSVFPKRYVGKNVNLRDLIILSIGICSFF